MFRGRVSEMEMEMEMEKEESLGKTEKERSDEEVRKKNNK